MKREFAGLFVAGTDTGVGKTFVARSLVRALVRRGTRVAAMKPVAAGAVSTAEGLRNADALELIAAANVIADYECVNPYCLPAPVSPHIAALESGISIDIETVTRCYHRLAAAADWVIVEGAGGWLVPINASQTMADLAAALRQPVLLVVGLRLGCLNHALLTAEAIHSRGLRLAGWIGNHIDPRFERAAANLATLERLLGQPAACVVPFDPLGTAVASAFDGAAERLMALHSA